MQLLKRPSKMTQLILLLQEKERNLNHQFQDSNIREISEGLQSIQSKVVHKLAFLFQKSITAKIT